MSTKKIVQIVIIVLGVAALGYLGFRFMTKEAGPKFADRLYGVDVVTGDLYYFEVGGKKGGVLWPEQNPETGESTILPVAKDENGNWVVRSRHLSKLGNQTPDSELIDKTTGLVTSSDAAPKNGR